ncbi:Uncharacterized protein GBIM_10287 [Gryllus bimaculatus]|nr:Uncharacterized protein GBIM_10287 [Gryllus bimaculatus]
MASSKVARRRQGSLPKEPPPAVDISDSDGEKDCGLDDFEIIKTIGGCVLHRVKRQCAGAKVCVIFAFVCGALFWFRFCFLLHGSNELSVTDL